MMNEPQPSERPRGQRGDTTETYVRRAQNRADRGAAAAGAAETGAGSSDAQSGGGLMRFLSRLWPFKRGG